MADDIRDVPKTQKLELLGIVLEEREMTIVKEALRRLQSKLAERIMEETSASSEIQTKGMTQNNYDPDTHPDELEQVLYENELVQQLLENIQSTNRIIQDDVKEYNDIIHRALRTHKEVYEYKTRKRSDELSALMKKFEV